MAPKEAATTSALTIPGDGQDHNHGVAADEPRNANTRTSSFFRLNKQSKKSIPHLKVSIEDLTYCPVTAAIAAAAPSSGQPKPTTTTLRNRLFPRKPSIDKNASATANHTKEQSQQQQPTQNPQRTLVLDKINTEINPFELTAWMGPSGSGKTSLTSVVAGLVDPSDVTGGSLRINGEEGKIPKQMVGVVWQDDLLLSNLTVEETIYFAARLKTPSSVSDGDVKVLVEETMRELGLLHIRNNLIGSPSKPGQKISGGERKRTAVAVELVVRPPLLLCDEPTSGLDATTALSLVMTLKNLASLGHSIAVVIHQPRTDIFNLLDRVLLLSRGRAVYDGRASGARSYLESLPGVPVLPPETGIADWIMDTIIADERKQQLSQEKGQQLSTVEIERGDSSSSSSASRGKLLSLADYWANRPGIKDNDNEASLSNNSHNHTPIFSLAGFQKSQSTTTTTKAYEASFWRELRMLTSRTNKQHRGDKLTLVSLLLTLTYFAFTSFLYWRIPDDVSNIYERNSLIFFLMIAQGLGIVNTSIAVFNRERALLRRERAKKLYRVLPFFLAKVATDTTTDILLPLVYGFVTYWTAGLRPSVVVFLKFLLGYHLNLTCAQGFGFFLSILYPDMAIAMILAPPVTMFMYISAGFYIPLNSMNAFMKWISYLSFARYGYSALLINEYEGRTIPCPDGGLDDNSDGGSSGITIGGSSCPLPGEAVYESMGMDGALGSYWLNLAVLAIFNAFFLVGAYALLRRSK